MSNRDEQRHESPGDVPPVGRPRGAVWRSLQADGVVWEGQVLLVGDDVDLAARMVVTHRRVVFVRGGELVLDMSRSWLRPEPVLRRDGVLDLFVAMPGGNLFDEPLRVPLRLREGHSAAGHIIAMLAPNGVRRIAPDALSGLERARESTPPPRFGSFWDDEHDPHFPGNGLVGAVDDFDQHAEAPATDTDTSEWAPLEPPDRVVRMPSAPQRRPGATAFPIAGMLPRDQRRSPWRLLVRVGALTVLLATAAALGAGRVDFRVPGSANEPILVVPTATVPVAGSPSEPPAAALSPEEESAIAIGVGGPAGQTDESDGTTTAASTATSTETPVAASTPGTAVPAIAPTEPVIPTPAATPPPPATTAPVAEATASNAPATVSDPPAAFQTSPVPATSTQAAAVATGEPPAQEMVVGPLRLSFSTALRAESLPRYALPPGSGEWLLLVVELVNEGDSAASLAMSDFRLFDRGTAAVVDLDTGTDVIATLAGLDPARSNDDDITVEPGESTETLLLYLLPPGSTDDLALIVGPTSIDLSPSLAMGDAVPAESPELVEATVTDILDGSLISVDIAGLQETVRYLGLESPADGACFYSEATTANAELVDGAQVWLERQATDRGEDNVLLRDVWIINADGERFLVAARLLEAGAGTAAPAAPDTRYQAWLEASAALARSNGAGLWGACPGAAASANIVSEDSSPLAYMRGTWRARWGLTG